MEVLLERATAKRAAKSQSRREVLDHLDFTEKQLQLVTGNERQNLQNGRRSRA